MSEDNIKIKIKKGEKKRKLNDKEYEEIEREILGVIPDLKFLREFWEYVCDLEEELKKLKEYVKEKSWEELSKIDE